VWRGFCLIINNYDFRACTLGNREGTDIDKERLEVVFKWLGFEVLVEQDCNRHQILQVLRNLAARDHTPADCAVCCVLSHGRVEGICGVDGEIVTFRELIETLSPNECPSLCKKPKLFFIQACRGNNNQPAAFPQTCSEDEDMLFSDAAVPRDSIPEMADYLLAMSTVPHYVSYREKSRGTWFIQSLCHSLQLLVFINLNKSHLYTGKVKQKLHLTWHLCLLLCSMLFKGGIHVFTKKNSVNSLHKVYK
uniref:Caspase-8-like n=1 Tax=Sinocyclocheilus grahami TaxID=75366 RepID=A0A672RFG8_SINGR